MNQVFDSLTHPTLSGEFLGRQCSFEVLAAELKKNGIERACAVGIPGIGSYEHGRYMDKCRNHGIFFPVAGLDPKIKKIAKEIVKIRSYGYTALKIHPRFCGWDPAGVGFSEILSACGAEKITVFFCTYSAGKVKTMPSADLYWSLVKALKKAPSVKVVLTHGGCSEILRYAELVRANSNLLLDTSFTLMKYHGSSLDMDIRFLFETLDQRICVGSDAPDFLPKPFSERFSKMCRGLAAEKKQNIGFGNLASFLGVS